MTHTCQRLALPIVLTLLVAGGGLAPPVEAADAKAPDILIADFEGDDYGDWKATGEAFGSGPARGPIGNQLPIPPATYRGKGLVNSFIDGDKPTGKLISPPIRIERPFINFLIGGGAYYGETCMNLLHNGKVIRTATGMNGEALEWHTWGVSDLIGRDVTLEIVDAQSGGWGHINVDYIYQSAQKKKELRPPLPFDIVLHDFEGKDYGDWKTEGDAFGDSPASGWKPHQAPIFHIEGKGLANSAWHKGHQATGKLISPPFTIQRKYVNFKIGGGGTPEKLGIRLLHKGKAVRTASPLNYKGTCFESLRWHTWDVSELMGREVVIEIYDDRSEASWSGVNVDMILQSNVGQELGAEPLRERKFVINKDYIALPVMRDVRIRPIWMKLTVDGKTVRFFHARLAPGKPDLWLPLDVRSFKGKTAVLSVDPWILPGDGGLKTARLTDTIRGHEPLYDEALRPQLRFSQQYGWNNDPNGMVYYDGEYHLCFQHDPMNWVMANFHWGHAVSKDLVHWEQLPDALIPNWNAKGHCYSGSAVVDVNNTGGFQTGAEKTIAAFVTDHGTGAGESLAYSTDRGRTFTFYEKNPVVMHDWPGRDPKVFWYPASPRGSAATGEPPGAGKGWWVMVVYDQTEGIGANFAFYTSKDLKEWEFASRLLNYYECPELYELPVLDAKGKPTKDSKWVVSAADGQYAMGQFDGRKFVAEHKGKHKVFYGSYYAAQTFSQVPGGRRIQIGFAVISMPGMPFNQGFTLPHELTLRRTADGVRLFAEPVKEIEMLRKKRHKVANKVLTKAAPVRMNVAGGLFDIRATFVLGDAAKVGLNFGGEEVVYHVERAELDGAPLKPVNGRISMRVLVDRPMLEIIGNDGRVYITRKRANPAPDEMPEIKAFASGGKAKLVRFEVHELESIWSGKRGLSEKGGSF